MRHLCMFALLVATLCMARSAPQAQKGTSGVPTFERGEPEVALQKGGGIVPRRPGTGTSPPPAWQDQKGSGIVPRQKGIGIVPSGGSSGDPPPPLEQQGTGTVPRWVEIVTVDGAKVVREFYSLTGELLGVVVDTGDDLYVAPKARGFLTALAKQTPIVKSKGMTRKRIGTPQHPRERQTMHGNLDYRNPKMR